MATVAMRLSKFQRFLSVELGTGLHSIHTVCVCITFCLYCFISGHLGCFHLPVSGQNVKVNISLNFHNRLSFCQVFVKFIIDTLLGPEDSTLMGSLSI